MKSNINREDIKYNFLKNIIIRFDFQGMDERELDSVISEVGGYLKKEENGYISKNIEISKEMDFDIDDPEQIEREGLLAKSVREQNVYVFQNRDPQVTLKISTTFALISIDKTKYVNCLQYCDTLIYIMKVIMEKIPYFSCTRFGLRKINQCILLDINKLNDYFEKSHYQIYVFGTEHHCRIKVAERTDHLFIDDYNLNLTREILRGELQGEEAYRINLDADLYLLGDKEVKEIIQNNTCVKTMNEILFNIYKDTITESFLQQLIDGSFDPGLIKGVMKNE